MEQELSTQKTADLRKETLNLTIRPVEPRDFDQWLPLWDGYNAFYRRSGPTALAPEITQMTWTRFFDAYEPVHALVAESDGQLLGITHYIYHRTTISIGPICYLQDLFTVESARGKGVARGLINEVYARAKLAGAFRVYWQTLESNQTAMQLYDKVAEKSGFIVYRMPI
jgi:GNAT superfamily N-acetyltransferase